MSQVDINENEEIEEEILENEAEDTTGETVEESNDSGSENLSNALEHIKTLEAENADMKDKMMRALAEAENIRRRAERERQDISKFAVAKFAKELLSVSDNLRRALDSVTEEQMNNNAEVKALHEGIEVTERELLKVFAAHEIKRIEPMDEQFDPNFHEVMFEAPIPGKEAGIIIQLVEAGYMIHDRLLRPAKVGVAKGNDSTTEEGSIIDKEV